VILPLKTTISEIDREESYADQAWEREFNTAPEPRYCVELLTYDTEKRLYKTYEFHSMVDKTQPVPEVGTIRFTQELAPKDALYLRQLRAELDELLGDETLSRWERFSDEELAEIASLVSATEESYTLTAGAEKISAEVEAAMDTRARRQS
jgi:hypothetical protein